MVKVKYEFRYILTKNFLNKILKNNSIILPKLTRINKNSEENPKTQILNLKSDFDRKNNPICKAFCHQIEGEEYSQITNEIDRLIIFAIDICEKKPYKVIILVSNDDLEKYRNSIHYKSLEDKNLLLFNEENSIKKLEMDFLKYHNEKE
jgi:hypothetical protein